FALLLDVTNLLPHWDFWFVGIADDTLPEWQRLKQRTNVRYWGVLQPEELGRVMNSATVGLIPFVQDPIIRVSLPLKAYEYVACGLPVVTVPIDALQAQPKLFNTQTTAQGFASAIQEAFESRRCSKLLESRREAAMMNSYDRRFSTVVRELLRQRKALA